MHRFLPARLVALLSLFLLTTTVAQADAPINPNLREALYHLPIPGLRSGLDDLFKALKQGESGGYMAKTTVNVPGVGAIPLQMYFFGKDAKQALFLVVDKTIATPKVFNNAAWKQLAGASMSDPIFSLSTVDFTLTVKDMPADFRKVVADSYFNVQALQFTSGFQMSARLALTGVMKGNVERALHFPSSDFTIRAGVVIPVPSDAAGAAALAAQLAADMKNADKVLKDQPDFFIEFQPPPGTKVVGVLGMPGTVLTDPTLSLTSHLVMGLKGNLILGTNTYITFFETPLTPMGVMDLGDFQFGFAAQSITLHEVSTLATALKSPQVKGGSFIKGIDKYEAQLKTFAKALQVFEIRNPNPIGTYVYADPNHPFPRKETFNLIVMGPTASETDSTGATISGPYLHAVGDMTVLKQKMGSAALTVSENGLHGLMNYGVNFKIGPLGRTGFSMRASADIDSRKQAMLMHGNVFGRALDVSMTPYKLAIESPATCATPFSLTENLDLAPILSVSDLMDALPGVNVDPGKLQNCIGKELEAAYKWVGTTGSSLAGYTASAANAELKKIADAEYNRVKDAARVAANSVSNSATKAFRSADNAFRKLGFKKKKHRPGPDPKFAASVFDWDFYYDNAQDLVRAGVDLTTSWVNGGFTDGRQGASTFDAKFYLNRYIDVKQNCGTDLTCALNHWLNEGIVNGRQGSAQFSVAAYMHRYPDLRQKYGPENYPDALQDWIDTGESSGRDGSPDSVAKGPVAGPRWAGSGGGTVWSDREGVCINNDFVTGFRLHTTKPVDGAQFQYSYSKWGNVHGSTLSPQVEVTLPRGEYFVRVDWNSTATISRMTFTTNRGRTFGPYGYNAGGYYSFSATPGEKLGCMWGSESSWLTQLVFSSTGPR